ncbi:hypothetical protein HRbin17_02164 [bacterium HR17]|uniref:ABC transporter permease protein NosY n=1 Tax=Candidatus Fervidibacter japonicus TaxID=2035412 RepID=A0A2H5XEN7_9BACT|nr:hypothetical protein HRbin17_02164 [bacterium HR17]
MKALEFATLATIAHKGLHDAKRHRWFVTFTVLFAVVGLALSASGFLSAGTLSVAGFGRTTASLVNFVLLLVPLMGLLLGALSVATEREQGTLEMLLTQPIIPAELLLGKWLGLAGALAAAVTLGFGLSAFVIAFSATAEQLGSYLTLWLFTLSLGWAHLSVGMLLSVAAPKSSTAVSWALFLWLTVVLLSDLGVLGTAIVLRLSPQSLLWLALFNPAQVFRIAVLRALQGNLELLGATGMYATEVFGKALLTFLTALLALWVVAPMLIALWLFARRP